MRTARRGRCKGVRTHRTCRIRAALLLLVVSATASTPSPAFAAATKRHLPDYDGRGTPPREPGADVLWIPRILLSPLYLVSEYLIRRPLGAAIAGAERANLPKALYDFFILTEDRKVGWAPIAFVDFGFKPSVGVYFFWDDMLARGNDLRVHASTWGEDWLAGTLTDRVHLGKDESLTFELSGIRRPDYRYYGEGPRSLDVDRSRYGADRWSMSGMFQSRLWGASTLEAGVGLRSARFYDSEWEHGPSTRDRAARGDFALPAAFESGYTAGFSRLRLRLDSRPLRATSGSGVRLEVAAEQGADPGSSPRGWIRYGATLGAALDLNQRGRVLGLSLAAVAADPLGSSPVPFTELAALGGSEPMRGFLPGRLWGRTAAAATLSYTWPVWVWLDGAIQAAVGNVYGEHFSDFEPSLLRFSGAIGVRTSGVSDNPLELLVGCGSETFEQGAEVTSFRLVLGTGYGL